MEAMMMFSCTLACESLRTSATTGDAVAGADWPRPLLAQSESPTKIANNALIFFSIGQKFLITTNNQTAPAASYSVSYSAPQRKAVSLPRCESESERVPEKSNQG